MNIISRIFFVILCCSLSSTLYSQKKISLSKLNHVRTIDAVEPLMVDAVNLKGNKFLHKDLLETIISIPSTSAEPIDMLSADISGFFQFQKPQKNARFYLVSFQITSDRYSKMTLKVTAPSLFEVYIDGKKELSKTTIEDSLHLAKMVDKSITMLPSTSTVFIKYLSLSSNISREGLKISIEPEKGDSLTNYKISYDGKRNVQVNDMLEGTRITSTDTSPDGRFVLISYKSVASGGGASLFTELLDTKLQRRISFGNKHLRWMPTSNKLFYTNNLEGNIQLITIDPATMSEVTLSDKIPSGSFDFTPDEKFLLYADKESNDDRKGDLKLLASLQDRQADYFDRHFISKYHFSTGLKQRLTFGQHSTIINDVSADSRHLLFSTQEEDLLERPFRKASMFNLNLETLVVDTLWIDQKYVYGASFSPDAKSILILGAPEAFGGIGLNVDTGVIANSYDKQAFIMNLSTLKIDPITKNFDPAISDLFWNNADNKIYFRVSEKDCERVYMYDYTKKYFHLLPLSEEVIRSISFARNATSASYFGLSASNSTKAYSLDLKSNKSTLISDPYHNRLNELKLGEVKDWSFKASDGSLIEGRYYLPPNFDVTKKYPMIVYYYGGTTPTLRIFDHPYPMHVFAALGYVVYTIQPSGTIGFGQKFSARHVNAWGKRTADDIIEGVTQFLGEHTFIDASKIGCLGASYGGFMTMYLQTQTNIFAAAISHAGISSLSSYWGEGYWGYSYSGAASADSFPWNNKELYVEQSPLFSADKINTPLLLLHGLEDTNVPIGESIQMYTALKILGKPVEFIQVKGENHGIANHKRRIEWSNSIYAWFAKWLKNDSVWWDAMYPQNGKKSEF